MNAPLTMPTTATAAVHFEHSDRKSNAPLRAERRCYTSIRGDDVIDLCLISRDDVPRLVSRNIFSISTQDELAHIATPSAYPGVVQIRVGETAEEIETVQLARSAGSYHNTEVYARITQLDAKATVYLLECFARYDCCGFEGPIENRLVQRLSGKDRHLLEDLDWVRSTYGMADAMGLWGICEFLWPHFSMFEGPGDLRDGEASPRRRHLR